MDTLPFIKTKLEFMVIAIIFFSCYKVSNPTVTPSPCASCGGSPARNLPSNGDGYETKTLRVSGSDWTVDSAGVFRNDLPGWSNGLSYPSYDYYMDKAGITYKDITLQLQRGISYPIAGGMIKLYANKLYFTPNMNGDLPALLIVTVYLVLS
jgi:hypothetical protein